VTDAESLSVLIGEVYDATLDAAWWSNVLEKAAQFVCGSAASLYCQDPVSKTGNATCVCGLDVSSYSIGSPISANQYSTIVGLILMHGLQLHS
jgi:hypothetical protein